MNLAYLRRQDGILREGLYFFLAISLVAVIALDTLAIFSANRLVRQDVREAAREAAHAYVQMGSDQAALNMADSYLRAQGDQLTGFAVERQAGSSAVYHVTASRKADTYVAHYLTDVPRVGPWLNGLMTPSATGANE